MLIGCLVGGGLFLLLFAICSGVFVVRVMQAARELNAPAPLLGAPPGQASLPAGQESPASGSPASQAPATSQEPAVPNFPELGAPRRVLPSGVAVYFIDFAAAGNAAGPGMAMKLRVYLPPGEHTAQSLTCVLVAPAGTNLLVGNDMDDSDYHAETLPYAEAGMAVVFYSLDGGIADQDQYHSEQQFVQAVSSGYRQFKAAAAGVVNGRNALEFVLARLPQVDPGRICCAGHSSAGTHSLLLAQHEPRIHACIAYAPATDVELRLADLLSDPGSGLLLPGLREFLKSSSPKNHIQRFACPVFVFHALDDSNEPFSTTSAFVAQARQAGANITFEQAARGDHYQSMIDEGLPKAIAWLQSLP